MPAKRTRHSKSKALRNAQPATPAVNDEESSKLGTGLNNEGFVIDLFLDRQKQVHLTQVLHVKSNDGEGWEGWDEKRLIDFFIDRAQLSILKPGVLEPEVEKEKEILFSADKATEAIEAGPIDKPVLPADQTPVMVHQPMGIKTEVPPEIASETAQSIEHAVEIVSSYSRLAGRSLVRREPFDVRILLVDTNLPVAEETEFDYTVSISAHKRGQNSHYFIAADQGLIKSTDEAIRVNVPRQNLEPGTYRLRAKISITTPAQPEEGIRPVLLSSLNLKSGLLQVI